jgi:hypothetical protein
MRVSRPDVLAPALVTISIQLGCIVILETRLSPFGVAGKRASRV